MVEDGIIWWRRVWCGGGWYGVVEEGMDGMTEDGNCMLMEVAC